MVLVDQRVHVTDRSATRYALCSDEGRERGFRLLLSAILTAGQAGVAADMYVRFLLHCSARHGGLRSLADR